MMELPVIFWNEFKAFVGDVARVDSPSTNDRCSLGESANHSLSLSFILVGGICPYITYRTPKK
jgi:hypothetical protein